MLQTYFQLFFGAITDWRAGGVYVVRADTKARSEAGGRSGRAGCTWCELTRRPGAKREAAAGGGRTYNKKKKMKNGKKN